MKYANILWGNRFIKHKGKCLIFKSWIDSKIFFYRLYHTWEIDVNRILTLRANKRNWISEVQIVKRAIPNMWKTKLKLKESCLTKVKTELTVLIDSNIPFKEVTNKTNYEAFLKRNLSDHTWTEPLHWEHSTEKQLTTVQNLYVMSMYFDFRLVYIFAAYWMLCILCFLCLNLNKRIICWQLNNLNIFFLHFFQIALNHVSFKTESRT